MVLTKQYFKGLKLNTPQIDLTLPEAIIIQLATLLEKDRLEIQKCRGQHNRLGFTYQLMFVKIFNRFPNQFPLEIQNQVLTFASVQLTTEAVLIEAYQKRQQTISQHQIQIRSYLSLASFDKVSIRQVNKFIFEEAQCTEHSSILLAKTERFLKEQRILQPAHHTLERLIITQRKKARQFIYDKMLTHLTSLQCIQLDELLKVDESRLSSLQQLKRPPAKPSPKALLSLTKKLETIHTMGIHTLDTSWLNNNYQRSLAKYVFRCSAKRLRELQAAHRYTALVCFLKQLSLDTTDYIIEMHHKLMLKVYHHANVQMDEALRKQRKHFKQSQVLLHTISGILLDDTIEDAKLREAVFEQVGREELEEHLLISQTWLTGKFSHLFNLVIERFSYLRQFSPALITYLEFEAKGERATHLLKAIDLLHTLNQRKKRKLPEDAPIEFIPKKLRYLVKQQNVLNRQAWECALLTSIRDEIKVGNLTVKGSKRFGNFDNFFIPYTQWEKERTSFFTRAGLPDDFKKIRAYFTQRLNKAFDTFFATEQDNLYAKIESGSWTLSVDTPETLSREEETALETLTSWLNRHMRSIKLPQLLIEVDNDLHFTRLFMLPNQQAQRQIDNVCAILVSIMAHGCFIGPYTMAKLILLPFSRHIEEKQRV